MGGSPSKPSIPVHPEGKEMDALVFSNYNKASPADALSLSRVPVPVPSSKEVLIKMKAAALNPIDKLRVAGELAAVFGPEQYNTTVLGYDGAGIIEEVGSDVTKFKVGDEVYVRVVGVSGTIAEYAASEEDMVALKPSSISFEEAASIPLAGVTGLQALRRGEVKEGDKVMITGGSGGVGSLTLQIAKHALKAEKVVVTASAASTDLLTSLGADAVVDYKTQDFSDGTHGDDFNFGFDCTGESAKLPAVVKENGKVVTIVGIPSLEETTRVLGPQPFMIRTFLKMKRNKAALKNAAAANVQWSHLFLQPNGADLETLAGYVDAGELKPVLDNIWELKDWRGAVDRLMSGRSKGKCVIRIQ